MTARCLNIFQVSLKRQKIVAADSVETSLELMQHDWFYARVTRGAITFMQCPHPTVTGR